MLFPQVHGIHAVNLRIAEKYLDEFGKLAKENNTMIIPSNLSDVGAMVAATSSVFKNFATKNQALEKPVK